MASSKGIMAYGTDLDRRKLAVLSKLLGESGSHIMIQLLREKYDEVVGDDVAPERFIPHH